MNEKKKKRKQVVKTVKEAISAYQRIKGAKAKAFSGTYDDKQIKFSDKSIGQAADELLYGGVQAALNSSKGDTDLATLAIPKNSKVGKALNKQVGSSKKAAEVIGTIANVAGKAGRIAGPVAGLYNKALGLGISAHARTLRREGQDMKNSGKVKVRNIVGALTGINDASWYNNIPGMVTTMIGPNFNTKKNVPYSKAWSWESTYTQKVGVPSIAGIPVVLATGCNTDNQITTAMDRIFTSLRQANTGAANYTRAHVAAYIDAYRAALAMYTVGCKALRGLNTFDIHDNQAPYQTFLAMGLDYATFKPQAANLRALLIQTKYQLETMAIVDLDLFKRTEWLLRFVFHDSDDAKAQKYTFALTHQEVTISLADTIPANAITYSGGDFDVSTPAGLSYTNFVNALYTVTSNLVSCAPVYSIVSGDMLRTYPNNLNVLSAVPSEIDKLEEVYSEEVLTQIQNMTTAPTDVLTAAQRFPNRSLTFDAQTGEYVESASCKLVTTAHTYADDKDFSVVNMYKNDISNLDVLVATRLTATYKKVNSPSYSILWTSWGTEITSRVYVVFMALSTGGTPGTRVLPIADQDYQSVMNSTEGSTLLFKYAAWAAFDYMPYIRFTLGMSNTSGTTSVANRCNPVFDWNNFAFIETVAQLNALHDIATSSLYYGDLKAKVSNNVLAYNK